MTEYRMLGAPTPNEWCSVSFSVGVGDETVEVSVGWEGGIGVSAELVGTAAAREATYYVGQFQARQQLCLHRLLVRARQLYESAGENPYLGHIPAASVRGAPSLSDVDLSFTVDVDGSTITGKLRPDLGWRCAEPDPRIWATAGHAALAYLAEHRDEAKSLGFDTEDLDRQLRLDSESAG